MLAFLPMKQKAENGSSRSECSARVKHTNTNTKTLGVLDTQNLGKCTFQLGSSFVLEANQARKRKQKNPFHLPPPSLSC